MEPLLSFLLWVGLIVFMIRAGRDAQTIAQERARLLLQDSLGARFDALMPSAFSFASQYCDRIVATVFVRIGSSLEAARRHAQAAAGPHLSTPSIDPTPNPNSRQED